MLSANHWRLAASALAVTILRSARRPAGPLAMNDPDFPPFSALDLPAGRLAGPRRRRSAFAGA